MDVWQHLPGHLDPVAFMIGAIPVRWYALMFLIGFAAAFFAFRLSSRQRLGDVLDEAGIETVFVWVFFGSLLGARIGYAVLYGLPFFVEHPSMLFWPYEKSIGVWVGFSGMSFHGGLVGAVVMLWIFARSRRLSFLQLADELALVVPIALFFGRLGNFLNNELPGRMTDVPWGMLFPQTPPAWALRHPSTLYEALLEGGLLFIVVAAVRRRYSVPGVVSVVFLGGYACIRFIVEYFREPDPQIGVLLFGWSLGQWCSTVLAIIVAVFSIWLSRQNNVTIPEKH
jgi:phosphatidylglycerol---prolipoprotein diacylglyceryl transferase